MNIWTVHIELVKKMSTHAFVLVFIRFTKIYRIPAYIYSDNGWSFIRGCNFVNEFRTSNEFVDRFGVFNIKHLTIPLYSAWMGSVWERMIKTIKLCLYKTIGLTISIYLLLLQTYKEQFQTPYHLQIVTPNSFLCPYVNEGLLKINCVLLRTTYLFSFRKL